jgi:hypothetical protein
VAYDDGDPENHNGPINSQIFSRCWANAGKPSDFFALEKFRMSAEFSPLARIGVGSIEQRPSAGSTLPRKDMSIAELAGASLSQSLDANHLGTISHA